jgi:alpha,alpha-trehalase
MRKPATIDLEAFDAAVFDLDGIITQTASLHAAAWKELFDDYLRKRAARTGEPFEPFDLNKDYLRYVDGKPRYDGIRSFLGSRNIVLEFGSPDDPPDRETICGLGNRKNELFNARLAREGVKVFESSVSFVRNLRDNGIRTGLVSSSKNTRTILERAGLEELFDVCVDGIDADRLALKGKPDPDIFLEAARLLDVLPARAFGLEDAISGVQALKSAGYGLVIGVDRSDQAEALREHGADIVVRDLGELQIEVPRKSVQLVHVIPGRG